MDYRKVILYILFAVSLAAIAWWVSDSLAISLKNYKEPVTQADLIVQQVRSEDPEAQVIEQTEHSLRFRLSNGQFKLVQSMSKLFTQDGKEVNTELKKTDGRWVAETTDSVDYVLKVGADGSRKYTPRKHYPTEYIEFGPLEYFIDDTWQVLPLGDIHIDENRIAWESDRYTLEQFATPWGSKINFIIQDASHNYPIRWKVIYNNVKQSGNDLVSMRTGERVTALIPPTWSDSAEKQNSGDIEHTIENEYITFEAPDLSGAVYPVTIDPTANFSPAVSGDDGYINPNFNNSNIYMLFGEDSTPSQVHNTFLRFPSVNIPKGSTITAANIDFRTTTNTYIPTTCTIRIYGMAEDNHVAPTTAAEHTTDHGVHTTAYADWVFTLIDADNSLLSTPDIAGAIQEVIDRSGWATNNAIGVHVDENMGEIESTQGVASWDHSTFAAPILNITYNPRRTILIVSAGESENYYPSW